MSEHSLQTLIAFFEARDSLTDSERETLERLPHRRHSFHRNEEMVETHTRPKESCIVLKGLAARAVYLKNGARQLTAVHVPGDFVDLHAFLLKFMDHSVIALGECDVAFVPHEQLLRISEEQPHLTRLFWMSTVIDAAIHRSWLTCIGRRSPEQHIAHLFCEVYLRLETVGAAKDMTFEFPVTQAEMADMLGLSVVHVNRTIQQLRAKGFVNWDGATVTIKDFARLSQFSEFDPTYLSLMKTPR
ncbi:MULTISPECIES: Crp/Fnr family transcriptional regulator [Mesorhizobium]|nr:MULTISPECIES: Crp/Fnr family transcriptional regulator [Mesorhizobium]